MKDFRIKILGLAAMATLFASASYGQQLLCAAQTNLANPVAQYLSLSANTFQANGAATSAAGSPLLLRSEGTTELVADIFLQNCEASASAPATVVVFMSQPVTSKVTNSGVTPNITEAAVLVTPCTPAAANPALPTPPTAQACTPNAATVVYYGTVSGSTITFAINTPNFPAAGAFNIEIANVRVNASLTGATTSPVSVTESLFAGFAGQSTLSLSGIQVGNALQSLVTPAFTLQANGLPLNSGAVICVGNTVSAAGTTFTGATITGQATASGNFSINIADTLGGFFKSGPAATALVTTVPSSEYGTFAPSTVAANAALAAASGGTPGVPTHGTRIQVAMSGVPSAATVYVPLSVTVGGATLTLTSSASGGFSAVSPSTTLGVPSNLWAGLTGSGTVTAVYEVTTANAVAPQSFSIPAFIAFSANSSTATTITVLESYAPNSSTDIPNFAVSTATPLTGPAITACVTNLLFPFVTSQLGFDTGLAIANTSADPFGKFGAVPSGTTAPAGACILNYYGTGAPTPSTVTTPSIASGAVYALVNSSVAPGFQGYIIVQCPFVAGHGYAFVTNTSSAGNAGVAQGYTALSMAAANSGGTKRIGATGIESLGQ